MSIALRRFENSVRPAYEAIAAVCWTGATLVMVVIILFSSLPKAAFIWMAGISSLLASWRWYQVTKLWDFKLKLFGQSFAYMKASVLKKLMGYSPADLWVGFGFDWTPVHTQRALDIRKRADTEILPPAWYLKIKGANRSKQQVVGKPWIHGLGLDEKEKHIFVPLASIEGHNLVFGTTGAGKTRLFETLITQDIMRGDVVVVIDPKGDKELRDIAKAACKMAGRPNAFVEFHPAFPSRSIRLDPLKNWNNATEIASRIAALMPSESGSDSFTQMAWKAVHVVSEGLIYVDQMPNLMRLRRFIEGGPEGLMEEVLRTYLTRNVDRWQTLLAPVVQRARDGKLPSKMAGTAELIAYVYYYKHEVPESRREPSVDGLLSMVEHNREHLGKILASLVPLLVMLTAGELGKMLSPDANDMTDTRPIFDTKKIVNGGHVLYLGLDSLSNATVGSALGSVILADFAAVAGERYNYGTEHELKQKIKLYVNEAAEVVNLPLIQILNKGRGAGFVATLAAQTLPDFIARMGDEARARQILGNCNNLIALRTKDRQTQDFVVETFGTTHVQSISRSIGSGQQTDNAGMDYRNQTSQSLQETEAEIFAPELLGMLPNLHYIAFMSGGRLIKGRLPKLLNE